MNIQYSGNTTLIVTLSCIISAGCVGVGSRPVNLSLAEISPPTGRVGETSAKPIVRNQSGGEYGSNWGGTSVSAGADASRYPMPVSGPSLTGQANRAQPIGTTGGDTSYHSQAQFTNQQSAVQGNQAWPAPTSPSRPTPPAGWDATVPRVSQLQEGQFPPPVNNGPLPLTPAPQNESVPISPPIGGWPQAFGPPQAPTVPGGIVPPSEQFADIIVNVQETQTGRLMVGAAVNSDAGLTGQIVIDERNFDWRRIPRSFDDVVSGNAFRGAGQGFRIEALPGREVQRYMVQFTEPYLGGTRISFNLSAYIFDRRYFDWDEQRGGGRIGLGYRITPDMSISAGLRAEGVNISDPRVLGVEALDDVLGDNELYSGRISLVQDTRDIPFAPTQGYFLELSYDQVFGSFEYPRGSIDWRRYFLIRERPDGSGRHVLGFSNRLSISGSETPIYENYFAGGHATLRGFEFRGASPQDNGVIVGGRLMTLGSVEYLFPITADDMLKGVVFCDYGTVEEDVKIDGDDYRVALGAGLRVSIPAMGPAPIALDFAVPVAREDTDDIQNFSFFVGVSR